jgi:hypothetical protein
MRRPVCPRSPRTPPDSIEAVDWPSLGVWPPPESASLTSAAAQVSTEDTSVMVQLTLGERDLVKAGLELRLAGSRHEERPAAPVRAILARIAHAESARPKELVETAS